MVKLIKEKEIRQNIIKWASEFISPDFEFRPNQLDVIIKIVSNVVNHGKQVMAVEAPTGTGKSLINIISAGVLSKFYNKKSYILCSDLFLWSQYDRFIKAHDKIDEEFGVLKGQLNNYKCIETGDDLSLAPCKIKRMPWRILFNFREASSKGFSCASRCPYIIERKKAVNANVCLMTYQLYFKMVQWQRERLNPAQFTNKEVVFCDECHNLSNIISAQYNLDFKETDFDILKRVWDIVYDAGLLSRQLNLIEEDNKKDSESKNENDFFEQVLKSKDAFPKKLKEWRKQVFSESVVSKSKNYKLLLEVYDILSKILTPFVDKKLEEFKNSVQDQKEPLNNEQKNTMAVFNAYEQFYNDLCGVVETFKQCGQEKYLVRKINYVFDVKSPDKQKIFSSTYLCAREDWMIYNYLLTKSEYKVFVSATIGSRKMLEESLGIDYYGESEINRRIQLGTMFYDSKSKENPTDFEYIRLETDFDFSRSPIYFVPGHRMSFNDKAESMKVLKPLLYRICNSFENQKGVIQTGSYQLMNELINDAPEHLKRRFLAYDNPKVKNEYIKQHSLKDDANSILIGPTLCEGIDLPDDLCRFIIIFKVPYPNLKDELTKEKIKLFPNWYNSTTSNLIIQGIGRGNRNKNDYCTTFILDGCFGGLFSQTFDQYPDFIKNRIKLVKL